MKVYAVLAEWEAEWGTDSDIILITADYQKAVDTMKQVFKREMNDEGVVADDDAWVIDEGENRCYYGANWSPGGFTISIIAKEFEALDNQ